MPDQASIELLVAAAIRDQRKCVVAILGAGASKDAGVPLGCEIGEQLDERERAILSCELGGKPETWHFFPLIRALSKFCGEEKVRKRLTEILKPRFISLGYEILAHYLHRDEIKAVVTLNHDEAFDHSLDLESPEFRWSARSRSEFDNLLGHLRSREGLPPAYLKVHGCVSRTLTFRIVEESVEALEAEKLGVLQRYLAGADVILCIGWAMHDSDIFQPLVAACRADPKKTLIVVNPELKPELARLVSQLDGHVCATKASDFLGAVGYQVELGRDAGPEMPSAQSVGLHRHRIRAMCFGSEGALRPDEESQAALEIVMFALKARAQIEPRILFECGRTSQLLAEAGERFDLLSAVEARARARGEKAQAEAAELAKQADELYSRLGTLARKNPRQLRLEALPSEQREAVLRLFAANRIKIPTSEIDLADIALSQANQFVEFVMSTKFTYEGRGQDRQASRPLRNAIESILSVGAATSDLDATAK